MEKEEIVELFKKLPATEIKAYFLYCYCKTPLKETASACHIPVSDCQGRIAKALKIIQEHAIEVHDNKVAALQELFRDGFFNA